MDNMAEEVISKEELTKLNADLDKIDTAFNSQLAGAKELFKKSSDLLVDAKDLYDFNK